MGVKHLFGTPLSGYSKSTDLRIQGLIHVTKLKVDEEGTVAAAATISIMESFMNFEEKKIDFHCDHPFAYMIYNDVSNEIVFAGVYRGPN